MSYKEVSFDVPKPDSETFAYSAMHLNDPKSRSRHAI